MTDIKFINHACFTVTSNGEMVLFDPWFTGSVFNNSWSLLEETEIDSLDFSLLSFIAITHEHPDHLHWETLKRIKQSCKNNIKIIIPKRKNKNVKNNLIKLGYIVAEIPHNKEYKISTNFSISNFPTGHDSAYVLKTSDKVILNQNDCKLTPQQCMAIKSNYKDIDVYFMQFSLAGYYANKDDHTGLEKAKLEHIKMFEEYGSIFKPKITVPFASFIYFSRQKNSFLNEWIVNVKDLPGDFQVLFYGDSVMWDNDFERTERNKSLWSSLFSREKVIVSPKEISREEIKSNAAIFFSEMQVGSCPPTSVFELYGTGDKMIVDYKNKKIDFVKETNFPVAGKVTEFDINNFFKFPWGADTLNITSCFEIKNKNLWRKNLIFRDSQYKR